MKRIQQFQVKEYEESTIPIPLYESKNIVSAIGIVFKDSKPETKVRYHVNGVVICEGILSDFVQQTEAALQVKSFPLRRVAMYDNVLFFEYFGANDIKQSHIMITGPATGSIYLL